MTLLKKGQKSEFSRTQPLHLGICDTHTLPIVFQPVKIPIFQGTLE